MGATQPYEIGTTHDWLVMPMRATPWPKGGGQPWELCPVCKQKWRPWAGSLLPCHAKCIWTEQGAVYLFNDPRTETQLESALGLTRSIIRAGRHVGEKMKCGLGRGPSLRIDCVLVFGHEGDCIRYSGADGGSDEMMKGVDRSKQCDELNCALIAGHERQLTCRMRSSAVCCTVSFSGCGTSPSAISDPTTRTNARGTGIRRAASGAFERHAGASTATTGIARHDAAATTVASTESR